MEAQAWARAQRLALLADFSQSLNPSVLPPKNENQLILLAPQPNTTYRIDPNFDLSSQQLQIEVAAGVGISQITIWVDGNLFAILSSPPYQTWWTLSAGEHLFWAEGINTNGEVMKSEVVTIKVVSK
ncbi:Ig-like domain-containing protein [Candidatus Woesearchaeota archaeon]|nr:Ig-like domain-containing protein [Candidatus Woesearchaeota archaeon]